MPLVKIKVAKSPGIHSENKHKTRNSTPSKINLRRLQVSAPKEHHTPLSDMNSVRSASSDKSSSKRSTSSRRSKSRDNKFEAQHDTMMSRQQFRTNTRRSVSRNRVPREVNANNAPPLSIHGTQSYDSGYSQLSRKSDLIPHIIQRPESEQQRKGRDANIQNVKSIVAGMFYVKNQCYPL